ncbi:CCT motif [Musa troglodytarum]|uniref:CCT motif n=1 Tax=Musa troglodytarum TaxID=320322 RepID=A0A9E7IG66_9LILI|nr:CCT motif [Musa troglodytarum]
MFLSSSSAAAATCPFGEPGLDRPEFSSAVAPHGLITDADGSSFRFPSPFPPYSSSLPSEHYLRRSSSTRSLPLHRHILDPLNHPQPPFSSYPTSSSSRDYFDFHAAPMRRVVSTGDLQGVDGVHENYSQEGGAAGRVGRYSAEERKERIERYKSKRNQRNFHKKITYACRKTLADSRPRVRGRFARNGETGTEAEVETATAATNIFAGYSHDNYEQNQGYSVGGGNDGERWSRLQAALATDEEDEYSYDEDLLASFADIFSMDILS